MDEDRPQDTPKPADIEDYAYDALNRLVEVRNMNGTTVSYAYDAAGNRLNKTKTVLGVPEVEHYTYDLANKLFAGTKVPTTKTTLMTCVATCFRLRALTVLQC